jgi:hypothetical protein
LAIARLKEIEQIEYEKEIQVMKKREEEPCKHDWEVIERVQSSHIVDEIEDVIMANFHPSSGLYSFHGVKFTLKDHGWPQYQIKCANMQVRQVCLECGECWDNITMFRKKVIELIEEKKKAKKIKEERQVLAKKMWKSCEKGVKS